MLYQPVNRASYKPPRIVREGRFIATDPVEMRIIDFAGALALLMVFLPAMVLIALTILITGRGQSVFFAQQRIGRNGRMFDCYKFRTMAVDAESRLAEVLARDPVARAEWLRDHKLRNDPRIVGIGGFLRKSSLDELPQLWNVIKGDMSLVGPRPIVKEEGQRYGRYLAYYCLVKPGITGLWQINGRNDVSYRRRVAFDVIYARKCTTGDNMRILILTVPAVLMGRGSY